MFFGTKNFLWGILSYGITSSILFRNYPVSLIFRLNIFHQKAITHRVYSTDTRLILLSFDSLILHQRINTRAAHCTILAAHHIIGCACTALCCGPYNHLIYASLISLLWSYMPYALCKHMSIHFIYKYST